MKSFLWRHKSLVAIWLVVFGIAGYSSYLLFFKSSGNDNPYVLSNSSSRESLPEESSSATSGPTTAKVGEAVTDGDLEFTVFGTKCDETTIGTNQYAMDEAAGVFCRVSIQVKNNGGAAVSLPTVQRLVVAGGNEYKLDVTATQYAQADQTTGYWYENIAPGTTVTGDLVFDVPAAMTPDKAFLHGAEGSSGIEVTLQ